MGQNYIHLTTFGVDTTPNTKFDISYIVLGMKYGNKQTYDLSSMLAFYMLHVKNTHTFFKALWLKSIKGMEINLHAF
jgi:hypothetical protein